MPKQDEKPRSARRIVVTCTDNSGAENALTIGAKYESHDIKINGGHAYFQVRNDMGDLMVYGQHRFDTRVET